MSDIIIKQATLAELDIAATLFDQYRQFYCQTADLAAARNYLKDRINKQQSIIYLAQNNDIYSGFMQLYPSFSSISMAPSIILNDLFVTPDSRRQGIAKALMQSAIEHAKSVSAVSLSLKTAVDNCQAQSLYESLGWLRDNEYYSYDFKV